MLLIIPESLHRVSNNIPKIELNLIELKNLEFILKEKLPDLADILFKNNEINVFVRFSLNRKLLNNNELSDVKVKEGDTLEILIPISGG